MPIVYLKMKSAKYLQLLFAKNVEAVPIGNDLQLASGSDVAPVRRTHYVEVRTSGLATNHGANAGLSFSALGVLSDGGAANSRLTMASKG